MSCVDCSLCSVSNHSTRMGASSDGDPVSAASGGLRRTCSAWLFAQHAISSELNSVLPLLALPVTATSSPRGKQGFPKMRNRKCIGGSSLSRVMRSASSSRSSSVIECASTDC